MEVLVMDPGYSSFKFAGIRDGRIDRVWREPTAVAEVPEWATQVEVPGEGGGITWRGKRFFVGEAALIAGLTIPMTADGALVELAIPLYALKTGETRSVLVVLLSPADWGLRPRIQAVLKEAGFSEDRLRFFPQGLGIYLEAGAPSRAVVIDVGFNTVDVIYALEGKLLKDLSFAVRGAGLISFLSRIERDDPFRLARKLEAGDERMAGIIREHYWPWLERQLAARPEWNSRPSDAGIVFGGGGALFLKESGIGRVVKRPELANVRGMARFLLKSAKEVR